MAKNPGSLGFAYLKFPFHQNTIQTEEMKGILQASCKAILEKSSPSHPEVTDSSTRILYPQHRQVHVHVHAHARTRIHTYRVVSFPGYS